MAGSAWSNPRAVTAPDEWPMIVVSGLKLNFLDSRNLVLFLMLGWLVFGRLGTQTW